MTTTYALILGALLVTPLAHGKECAAPPVKSSQQAVCYATAYAEKNRLPHGKGVTRKVSKGKKVWTVSHETTKSGGGKGPGWEVEIDIESATPTRFTSHK